MNPQKVGWLHRSALFTVALMGVRKVDETESGIISEEALQDHHGAVMPPPPPLGAENVAGGWTEQQPPRLNY